MITQEQINDIVIRIVDNIQPQKVILFGSYAYGKPDENSDIDLLVIKDTDVPANRRGREIRKHLRGLCIPMDILVYTQNEIDEWKDTRTAFITQVVEKGKILYGQENAAHKGIDN